MTTKSLLGLTAVSVLLSSGCYTNPDAAAKRSAALDCKRLRECNKSSFEERYDGDLGRCKDDIEDMYLDAWSELEDAGCDYVPKEARKCLATKRKLKNKCSDSADQDINDDCEEVLDCPIGLDYEEDEPIEDFTDEVELEDEEPISTEPEPELVSDF